MKDLKIFKSDISDNYFILPSIAYGLHYFKSKHVLFVCWMKWKIGIEWHTGDWKKKLADTYYNNLVNIMSRNNETRV